MHILLQIVVRRRNAPQVYHLSRSLKKLGKSIGRKSRKSIARQCVNDKSIRVEVMNCTGNIVLKEMKVLSRHHTASLLRNTGSEHLRLFSWKSLKDDMRQHTPTLLGILQGCVAKKRKGIKCRASYRVNDEAVIGICAAILIRHQNPQMNLLQRLISMILYNGHAPKMVMGST